MTTLVVVMTTMTAMRTESTNKRKTAMMRVGGGGGVTCFCLDTVLVVVMVLETALVVVLAVAVVVLAVMVVLAVHIDRCCCHDRCPHPPPALPLNCHHWRRCLRYWGLCQAVLLPCSLKQFICFGCLCAYKTGARHPRTSSVQASGFSTRDARWKRCSRLGQVKMFKSIKAPDRDM